MPLYEYECESCSHRFERIQKFSDPIADTCPKCGGPVRKLVSSPAIQFKGSGWYITDYAKKSSTDSSSSTTSKDKSDKDKSDTKSDSTAKPETGSSKPDSSASTKNE